MKTKDDHCAIVMFKTHTSGCGVTDNIRKKKIEHLSVFIHDHLETNEHITYQKAVREKLIFCSSSCLEAANLSLKLRDTFLGINWREDSFQGNISPIIAIHFGVIQLHKNNKTKKYENISGRNVDYLEETILKGTPSCVCCTEDFIQQLTEIPTNNTKIIPIDNKIYSLHWENEFIQERIITDHDECNELIDSLHSKISNQVLRTAQNNLSQLIKETMCYNQGAIVQYIHRSSIILGAIKNLLKYPNKKFLEIKKNIKRLHTHFYSSYSSIASINFEYHKKIRKVHNDLNPIRLNTKMQVKGSDGESTLILTYGRDIAERYDKFYPFFSSSEDTAIEYIIDTGQYFICNDIPTCAINGRYKHPRLDLTKVKTLSTSQLTDDNWRGCWKAPISDKQIIHNRPASCFKSTLVIPMTLIKNKLPSEFWDELYNSIESSQFLTCSQANELEKTIFGYLCIDSPEANCFNEDFDINIGYFFADILSLYYFTMHVITAISGIYKKADTLIKSTPTRNQTVTHASFHFS